jgi:hypothetical protein
MELVLSLRRGASVRRLVTRRRIACVVPRLVILRAMRKFIATVSPKTPYNWEICKSERLWGVIERHGSTTAVASAQRVKAGDRIFIWLGKARRGSSTANGVIAQAEALGPFKRVGPGVRVPWPNPKDYAGVFPIRVVSELDSPVGDSFTGPNRTSLHFGLSNMALQVGFSEIVDDDVANKLAALFRGAN